MKEKRATPLEQANAGTGRSRGLVWLRLAVSLMLLGLVFQRIEEPARTFEYLRSARLSFLALLFGLGLLEMLYAACKWLVLLRCKLPRLGIRPVVEVQFLGSFLGQFLPGGGVDLVKIYGLTRVTGDLAFSFTSLLMDRLIGLLALVLVLLTGLTWEASAPLPGLRYLASAALAAIAVGALAITSPRFQRATDRMPAVVRDLLNKVYASLDAFRGRRGVLGLALVLALGINLLRVAVMGTAAAALGVEIPWKALLFIMPCVVFVMILPISMAGWGVREVSLVWLLQLYGVPDEQALATSLLIGLTGVVVSLPGAPLVVTGLRRVPATDPEEEPADRLGRV